MNIFFKKFAVQIFVVLFILFVLLLISSIAPFSAVGTQAVLNKKNRYWLQQFGNNTLKIDKLTGEIFHIKPCHYNEKVLCAYRIPEIPS